MLRLELKRFGLAYPTPVATDEEFEDLLLDYLLAPRRPSKIRLVERFLTRGGRALVAGDASHAEEIAAGNIAAVAHRFTVLVPEGLTAAETAMVTRVVNLEKPAHTAYEVRHYRTPSASAKHGSRSTPSSAKTAASPPSSSVSTIWVKVICRGATDGRHGPVCVGSGPPRCDAALREG